ncbi:MAG TPA: DUF2911 domain-containing protein [Blastocatellia bacterium]|nr:DUF2911 domain-containing protein [Blastocatellia bacterium]
MNLKKPVLCAAMVCALVAVAVGQAARGTAEATIKGKKITIDYGRPPLGSHSVSELPVGGVWRVGMNEATRIETTGDLGVGADTVKAGTYTLWIKRTGESSWVLAFHPKTEGSNGKRLWGAPPQTSGFIAQTPLKLEKAKTSADQLTIALADAKGKAAIKVQWGTDVLAGSFDVK